MKNPQTEKTATASQKTPENIINRLNAKPDWANQPQAQHSPLRQVTIAEYGTFFALKNGSETLATSPIKEPLVALAHAYNHATALAEALRAVDKAYQEMFDVMPVAFQTYAHIVEQALAQWDAK